MTSKPDDTFFDPADFSSAQGINTEGAVFTPRPTLLRPDEANMAFAMASSAVRFKAAWDVIRVGIGVLVLAWALAISGLFSWLAYSPNVLAGAAAFGVAFACLCGRMRHIWQCAFHRWVSNLALSLLIVFLVLEEAEVAAMAVFCLAFGSGQFIWTAVGAFLPIKAAT